MATAFALFQPISTFADDESKDDHGKGKKDKTHEKSGGKGGNREQAPEQPRVASHPGPSKGGKSHSDSVSVLPSTAAAGRSRDPRSVLPQAVPAPSARSAPSTPRDSQPSRYSGRGNTSQPYSNQGSYSRSNNYGGLWVHGDTHRDWERNRSHFWNHHQYGWYDGGWLIIDADFRPRDYSDYGYSSGSTVVQVQRRLNRQGYSVGYTDGVMGPATRNGIADYQRDYGLSVTGRINDPLLASLGLE